MYYQQGDVILTRVAEKILKPSGKKVLAEGEMTGHAHRGRNIELFEDEAGELFARASKFASVYHEEHKEIMVDEGLYEVSLVKEYDHFAEEARNVAD